MRCQLNAVMGLAVAVVALTASGSLAQPTAITYQGDLESGGVPASGPHDLRFRLFDAASGGAAVTSQVCADNVPVADGQFTITMDFGQQFMTAAARFLEIEVRADTGLDCSSAEGFVVLSPRQRVTAAPFATHAMTANALSAPDGSPADAVIVDNAGNLGIGTTTPSDLLHIRGGAPSLILQDTASSANQTGYISLWNNVPQETGWVGFGSIGSPHFTVQNGRSAGNLVLRSGPGGVVTVPTGNVGIGTLTPAATLDVRGSVRLGTAGEFFAVKSPANDRIIRGLVNANGTINTAQSSSGFTITHNATGVYTINFSQAFTSSPTLVVGATAQCCKPRHNGVSTTTAFVHVNNSESPYTLTDSPFTFIIIGP